MSTFLGVGDPARFRIVADGRTVDEPPGASHTAALLRARHLTGTTHVLHTVTAVPGTNLGVGGAR